MLRINVALRCGFVSVCSAFTLLLALWLVLFSNAGIAAGMDRSLPQQEDAEIQPTAVTVPVTWTKRIEDGFGLPQGEIEGSGVKGIVSLASFNDQLYAGASAWFNYGERRLSRSDDGQAWEEMIGVDFERWYNYEIKSLEEYSGYLYVGTSNFWGEGVTEGAEIWRSADGVTWSVVVTGGLGDAQQATIENLAEFDGHIYASTSNVTDTQGAEIWRSADGLEWDKVVTGGLDNENAANIRALYVYSRTLYAAVANYADGAEVWRSEDGLTWTHVLTGGSDIVSGSNPPSVNALADFDAHLYAYVTGRNGVLLLRCQACDGTDWDQANEPGFGNPDNLYRGSLVATEDALFAIIGNGESGLEVWRTTDGDEWEAVATGGFGDANNIYSIGQGAATVFADRLYVGTWNEAAGGQLWSLYLGPTFLVEVQRDANLRGGPGTSYAVIGGAKTGDVLEVVGQNEGGTWYQLGNDAWIAASLVVRIAPEPDAEADSGAPITPTVSPTVAPSAQDSGTVTPTVEATEIVTDTAELRLLLQSAATALEEESWRFRSEIALLTGITHTTVMAFEPPDRYDVISNDETHMIIIGDDVYLQEGDEWVLLDVAVSSLIGEQTWFETEAEHIQFVEVDELDGQEMLIYRYEPPFVATPPLKEVQLWIGRQDERIYKMVVDGSSVVMSASLGGVASAVEYVDATTTTVYEYDPEITVESPVE